MSRLPASRKAAGTARLALVGADTPEGVRLREALEAVKVPGERVDLYSTSTGEALLTEYAGEARLIQEPRLAEIDEHDVIFLCEHSELAREVAQRADETTVIIDLVGAAPAGSDPRLIHMDVNPEAARGHRVFAVPHPLAAVLGDLLRPFRDALVPAEVLALVVRPASDFGEEGVEELRQQTVSLLNFGQLPSETFGRQLAFNVVPQGHLACDRRETAELVARQVAELMGWAGSRLALRLLSAPVFYGHALQLHLRFTDQVSLSDVKGAIRDGAAFEPPDGDGPTTPAEVSDEYTTRLAELAEDGLGGIWIWAVAGEAGAKGAHQAVRLADAVSDL